MPKLIIGSQPNVTAPVTRIGKQVNHYQAQVPGAFERGTQAVKDAVTSGVKHIQQKKPKNVDGPKMKPQLTTDVFTPKAETTAEEISMATKPCTGHNVHGDKDAMASYFDNAPTSLTQRPGVDEWHEKVLQELEAKDAIKAEKQAKEAAEAQDYWQELIRQHQDSARVEQEIKDYFTNYFH